MLRHFERLTAGASEHMRNVDLPVGLGWPWPLRWPAASGDSHDNAYAPQQLWQPINPGWSFGNVSITTLNSSAPEVEQAVLGRHSYGRQIGRMMDALQVLIKAASPAARQDPAVKGFLDLTMEVRNAKEAARSAQLARLHAELQALKKRDPQAWERLVKA
jgi:hypothetical protein